MRRAGGARSGVETSLTEVGGVEHGGVDVVMGAVFVACCWTHECWYGESVACAEWTLHWIALTSNCCYGGQGTSPRPRVLV